ncbi:MAG: hypothetical protein ACRD82_08205, partial [Blastocatellia bacterium]
PTPAPGVILRTQIAATLLACLSLLAFADLRIAFEPTIHSQAAATIGNGWGWLAVSLSAAAWLSLRRQYQGSWFEKLSVDYLGLVLLSAVSLIVCSLSRVLDGWASYHALMIGVGVSAWMMFALRGVGFSRLKLEGEDTTVGWATCLGLAQFALTLRGIEAPDSIWWTVASLAVLSLLFGWMAVALKRRSYVYLSVPLLNLIASLLFARHFDVLDQLFQFWAVNVIVLSLASLGWLWLDLKRMRPAVGRYPFHRLTVLLVLPSVFLFAAIHWCVWVIFTEHPMTVWLNWAVILSVAALLIGCLWDDGILLSLRGIHLLGGVAILEACCLVTAFKEYRLAALTVAAFSLYALAVSWLWRKRESLARLAASFGVPETLGAAEKMRSWLLAWNAMLAFAVTLSSLAIVSAAASLMARLLVTSAAFALPAAFALL